MTVLCGRRVPAVSVIWAVESGEPGGGGEDRTFRPGVLGVQGRPHLLSPFCPPSPVLGDTAVLQERSQDGKVEMTVELVRAISQVSYFLSRGREAVLLFRI